MKPVNRIISIDAARGTAMLFVFVAHFASNYFHTSTSDTRDYLILVAMVASPTFIAISGLLLGFLYQMNWDEFGKIKAKLLDRGLFLLTVSHLIIAIAFIPHTPGPGRIFHAARWEFITDTIGFCIIVGPLLIDRIKPMHRLVLGLSIYLISWLVILFIHPENLDLRILKDTFFGPYSGENTYYYSFPLLPWFSFYFVNSCVGEKLAVYYIRKEEGKLSKTCLTIACLALVSAICIKTGYYLLETYNLYPKTFMAYTLTSPFEKLPPSPVYLLSYGGVGYFILFILFKFRNNNIINRYIEIVSVLGRTSLFVFMLQFYVYYVILYDINLRLSVLWPIYFIISAILIFAVAKIWDINNLNRFITVGSAGVFLKEFKKKGKIYAKPI